MFVMTGLQTDFSVTNRLLPLTHHSNTQAVEVSNRKDLHVPPTPGWQYMLPNDQGTIPHKLTHYPTWQSAVPNTSLPVLSSAAQYVPSHVTSLQQPNPELYRLYQAATLTRETGVERNLAGSVPLHHADDPYDQPSSSRTRPSSNSCSPLPPSDYHYGNYYCHVTCTYIIDMNFILPGGFFY